MKRTLLILGNVILGAGFSFAQQTPVSQTPQNKNVVLEELTGINCQYCPDGHLRAKQIADANPGRVVLVNIHAGGYATPGAGQPDLRTTAGTALDAFFDPTGYPAGAVQRTAFGTETVLATGRGNWTSQVTARLAEASPVNLAMNATIDAATRELTLNVEMFYTSPFAAGTNHYLNIGYVQNNYEGPQTAGATYNPNAVLPNGNYLHQHMFRGFLNAGGTWGEAIDASQTGVITRTVTFTLPASISAVDLNLGELQFFAFLHEGQNTYTNSKIISAAEVTPTFTNVPGSTVSAQSIVNEMNVCVGEQVTPVIKVKNTGNTVTAISFSASINGGTPQTFDWTGSIPFYGTQEITLPAMSFTPLATNSVVVTVTSVNGGAGAIGSIASSTKTISVGAISGTNDVTVKITTDQWGSETTWQIKNAAGTVLSSGGPYIDAAAAGTFPQANVNVSLPNGCYDLVVNDSYGDGFDSGYGNGKIEVVSGTISVSDVSNFPTGSSALDAFQTNAVAGLEDIENAIAMNVYPNPASDVVNVEFTGNNGNYSVSLLDLQGRVIYSTVSNNVVGNQTITVPVSEVAGGSYIVKVSGNGVSKVQNVVIK
jgi:hypothetical protein